MTRPSTLVATALLVAAGCGQPTGPGSAPPAEPPWFEDVTAKHGLTFRHDCGPVNDGFFLPQVMGSGAAFLDYDGDGRLDIYLIHNGGPAGKKNQLFHQEPDGTFRDVSAGSGLDVAGFGMGVAVADVNNDGRPDVLLTEYGATRLFLNEGGGRFRDVTAEAGIDNPFWGTAAANMGVAYADVDGDGLPDVFVTHLVNETHTLWAQGPRGHFRDRTSDSGLKAARRTTGFGTALVDFDRDGRPDLAFVNGGVH